MRYTEFARVLVEDMGQQPITKAHVEASLRQLGYEDFKVNGNKINALVQIPAGQKKDDFRVAMLNEILAGLKKVYGNRVQYSPDKGLSSLGGVVFDASPVVVVVKDVGKQGDNSAGIGNELEIASLLQSVIQKYTSANITFVDTRGKKMTIRNCTNVEVAGRDTADRKKADIVLTSAKGSLPISIKKLNADMWESADSMFGQRARAVIDKLVKDGLIKLNQIGERKMRNGDIVPVYELSKEIVMEPTEQEALNAVFGNDLNPKGGVVVQTFKPEHFVQKDNNVTVNCHAVITNASEIPESHMMVWQIRNDSSRNSESLGLAGIRPLGVTLSRGIGKKGTKDVILVDQFGNVVKNPNIK